jgi:hypothetical protein
MQLPPLLCYLLRLRRKYSPQHPILTHSKPTFLPQMKDQVSLSYKTTGKILALYILVFKFLVAKWKTKDSAPNDSRHFLNSICSKFLPE